MAVAVDGAHAAGWSPTAFISASTTAAPPTVSTAASARAVASSAASAGAAVSTVASAGVAGHAAL